MQKKRKKSKSLAVNSLICYKFIINSIKLNFLSSETRLIIKCVSWILFKVLTVGIFMKITPIEKWLWHLENLEEKEKWYEL